MRKEYRGYLLALASYLSGAFGTIASKLLIQSSSVKTTSVLWFFSGTILTFFLLIATRGHIHWHSIAKNFRVYMEISLIMSIAALSWFVSIDLAGPSIVAFVGQLGIVFGVLLGAALLHEHINWLEGLGGALSIAGAFAMTYRAGTTIELGVLFVIVNALGVAIQNLLVKRHIAHIDKLELVFVRSATALSVIFLYSLVSGGLTWPNTGLLPGFFMGSLIGYVLVNILLYQALGTIDLAKVSMLAVIGPPVVMVGSFLTFGDVPTGTQLVGSALIMLGVSLILFQPLREMRRTNQDHLASKRGALSSSNGDEQSKGR